MANVKDASKRRIAVPVTLDPEALAYLDLKAVRFARGKRGGRSEALNQIILLVKRLEPKLEELMREAE